MLPTGNGPNCTFLPDKTKFRLPLKLSLLRRSRLKSARASPRQCAQSPPDFIQIGFTLGGVIAERVYAAKTRRKMNPIIWLKPSFEPNSKHNNGTDVRRTYSVQLQ